MASIESDMTEKLIHTVIGTSHINDIASIFEHAQVARSEIMVILDSNNEGDQRFIVRHSPSKDLESTLIIRGNVNIGTAATIEGAQKLAKEELVKLLGSDITFAEETYE